MLVPDPNDCPEAFVTALDIALPLALIYGPLFKTLNALSRYTLESVVCKSYPVCLRFLKSVLESGAFLLNAIPKSLAKDDDSPHIYLSKLNVQVAFNTCELESVSYTHLTLPTKA